MTKAQLMKFIGKRNRSEFSSNLQFQIDADACGFRVTDLGDAKKQADGSYVWNTEHGVLREQYGKLQLETENARAA